MNNGIAKIAIDLTPILPGGENGGAKVFVLELIKTLAELHPETTFILLTQAASHSELVMLERSNVKRLAIAAAVNHRPSGRVRALAARFWSRLPPRAQPGLRRLRSVLSARMDRRTSSTLLRSIGADLLFCPFTAPTYFEPGISTVCTVYDLQYKTYPEFFSPGDTAHRDHVFVSAVRRASALLAISDYTRDSAIAHGRLDPELIRTIHLRMAHRIKSNGNAHADVIYRLNLVPERYVIYPANFWKHKNHEMLFTAFGMARCSGLPEDIKLVCTGSPGPRQDWLKDAVRSMGLDGHILFPGYLPNDELGILLARSAGMVFPSLYEGFGLPIVEAMAAGIAVACSDVTSLPEVAGNAAILFNPRIPTEIVSALLTLVSDEECRTRCIAAGRERAEAFADSERMAKEYWAAFQDALARPINENFLVGAYSDGWAGPNMSVKTVASQEYRSLEFEFLAPEWLPLSSVRVKINRPGKSDGKVVDLKRGESATYSVPLKSGGDHYEVSISPTFIPVRAGFGADERELSLILRRCCVREADGAATVLFE